jgi:hypothetical protein
MKKIQEKIKIYSIQYKSPTPPQTNPYGWQTPISPRKSAKREASRGLMKMPTRCLSVSIYLISMSPFSMWSLRKWCLLSICLIFLWKTGFLVTEMALVLSHKRELSQTSLQSLSWCALSKESVSNSYILGLSDGLCNRRLLSRRPANERRSKKMTSPRGALSINSTTHKIRIRKANKIKRRRCRISNPKLRSVFEISEDSLNCRLM